MQLRNYTLSARQAKALTRGSVLHLALPIDPETDERLGREPDYALTYARLRLPQHLHRDIRQAYEDYVWCVGNTQRRSTELAQIIAPIVHRTERIKPSETRALVPFAVNVVTVAVCRYRLRAEQLAPETEPRPQWPGGAIVWE